MIEKFPPFYLFILFFIIIANRKIIFLLEQIKQSKAENRNETKRKRKKKTLQFKMRNEAQIRRTFVLFNQSFNLLEGECHVKS